MSGVTTGELAREIGVTPGRVSQMVAAGKLDGCFSGDGRARRFDLTKVAAALGRNLDKGQMLGNGAKTKKALERIAAGEHDAGSSEKKNPSPGAPESGGRDGGELSPQDPDRYELARTLKAEEEARRMRRQNEEAEGTLVLASEVERQVARALAKEIAGVEGVLRDGARRIADELGVDFLSARRCLIETWRLHRGARAEDLQQEAASAGMTDAERDADF